MKGPKSKARDRDRVRLLGDLSIIICHNFVSTCNDRLEHMSWEVSRPNGETVVVLRLLSRPNSPTCRIITSNYRTSASGLRQCCVTTFIFIGTIGFVLLLPCASKETSHTDKTSIRARRWPSARIAPKVANFRANHFASSATSRRISPNLQFLQICLRLES